MMSSSSTERTYQVIVLANVEWEAMGHPAKEFARALAAKDIRVLYATGPLSIWDRGSKSVWHRASLLSAIREESSVLIDVPGKLFSEWPRMALWTKIVQRMHAFRLRRKFIRNPTKTVAVCLHPRFHSFVRLLKADAVVFWAVDLWSAQPGYNEEMHRAQKEMTEDADLLLAAGDLMGKVAFEEVGEFKTLRSANDPERIAKAIHAEIPDDLANIRGPRIGYTGRINPKVDFRAIAYVANARPNWSWVLIGAVMLDAIRSSEGGVFEDFLACQELPNVYFLGAKPYELVPSYIAKMDVNTICYRLDIGDWTRTAYPFKVHECLATGKPLVSARMPEVERHSDVVEFADDPRTWLAALETALRTDSESKQRDRVQVAANNTWLRRVEEFQQYVSELIKT